MAGEIQFNFASAQTTYFLIRDRTARIWNNTSSLFETYNAANIANYAISATEQSSSGLYAGTFPPAIPAGVYGIIAKQQLNAGPQVNDASIGTGDYQWGGSATIPLSDLATSGLVSLIAPLKVYRGEMVPNFPFKLISAADHVTPFVSGIVSGQISRDGGSFTSLQSGLVSEIGKGFYNVTLTSGDLFGNTIALIFQGVGISGGTSDQRDFSMILQRTSGY